MNIEINEKGSEAFYRQTVSVTGQYRTLIKKPTAKYKDQEKVMKRNIAVCAVMAALMLMIIVNRGLEPLAAMALGLMVFDVVICAAFLKNLKTISKRLMDEQQPEVLTMDEVGVSLNRRDGRVLRVAWDSLAFVRVFSECVCFFSSDAAGFVLSVDKRYKDQILSWLAAEKPQVTVIDQD
ncbi:MAG: hypothetical protein IJM17_02455 [Firmicutes bacterium]|nr:hypothetical protein [Bacillota bacterium]